MKFRAYLAISADGYVASPDGGVAWLDSYQGENYGYNEFLQQIDAIVLGRTSFDQSLTFGDWSYPDKHTFVLTSHPIESPPPNTVAWHDGVEKLVEHLRGMSFHRDVWLFGGPQSIHAFRELGAVDAYELYVIPVLLGGGIPMFHNSDSLSWLHLTDHHAFPDGVVRLVYELGSG